MSNNKSESDATSLAPSSPSGSPKRAAYFVQSPSRDSHDGDKSSSMHPTPNFTTPVDSPSHPSLGRHSRNSSSSRFSGIFRSSSGRKWGRKRNEKGWPECDVILEEGDYEDQERFMRRIQAFMILLSFVALTTVFCLIIWGAARPYKPEVHVKSLAVNNFYIGAGADFTGVPTKMLTINGSLHLSVYNPATFFGIYVTSTPVKFIYADIVIASGQLKKYFQPRKSRRTVVIDVEAYRAPLYGAGSGLVASDDNVIEVPLVLKFEIKSDGHVVGKLVRTRHQKHISCSLVINSTRNKPIKFNKNSCSYT
ncbi:hypothetical protein DCAR_0518561 [Daucus carota subsp. sativus]|uniref:Late embryogenesis abundant protein LEA-2 subgroup domain-containing protein n=1 Tax=Daucus carota subsp. sativus TaxID=79200 RepID=A0A162A010_DAUCS|nr:PREDICTED: uncharacterized protein LOC108220998 [Daucus carota subsp. sativus]WOG99213.1 hypothetical protein DCAR_0518561 [Daucus carota subsp. sativus]